MATIQYARLYPDTTQLQAKDGHNLTAGWVEVYLAGTDDPAVTYADFNGTRNPQRIIVDDNGRFCAIVDKSKAYRVEVYDADGMLQWTTEPVWCTGNAGAGMSVTKVVSTDGSIAVEENIDGSERTYDISIAPSDSDEFLEWIKCSEEDCGSTWHPVYQAGTMETEAGQGIKVHAGQLYHFTNTFYVDPNGTGINYDTFKVMMYCNDEIVDVRDFDIDSSLNDSVMCEFSTDLIPEIDGVVYYKLTIPSTCEVSAEVQCHRIYSGINAVPDTCATKEWVQETFDYNMSSKVDYSALEYNGNGDISGISGSAIAGGLDSAAVSSIASSYAESAISSISGWSGDFSSISSKIDWSSSGVFQPSGDYAYNSSLSSKADQSAFEQCCDEVHSALDEKLDKSASSEFQPSGQYVYESAYSSFSSEVTNNISSLSSNVSGISADMSAYVPFSGLEGEGGKVTGISGSAFKGHEYTGISPVVVDNVADTISVEHRTLCVDSTMTAYNSGSSAVIGVNVAGLDLSSKMDASASSLFYSTSNPSGFITGVDLTPYQLTADMSAYQLSGDYAYNSSVSSKADASSLSSYQPTSAMSAYATESWASGEISAKLDVTASSLFLTSLPADLAYTSDVASAVSGKLDASASSGFYPMTGNPSGFLTAHQSLAGLATEEYVDSAVSSKLDATAYDSAKFYLTSNPSGFVDSAYVDSQVSGKQNSGDYISAKGLTQTILNSNGTQGISFGSANTAAGIFMTGNFGTAYYKDNELNLNRNNMKIAFNIGGGGPQISAMSQGTAKARMFLFCSGGDSAYYNNQGLSGLDSAGNTVWLYDSAVYNNLTSVQDTVSANSAMWGQNGVNSATVSAIASSYAESAVSSKLDASASSDFYSTANPSGFVDAASASAIASAYQVVSSIGTAQNGLTSIVTSINTQKISAAYADMANKAFKDGTGRTISSLPDSAAVSAIASSYAESAVSGKLDESATADFYPTSNPSGFISGVDLTPYQLTADMSAYYTTANESGFIDSAYVEGQVSGKQDASAMTAYQPAGDYQPSGDYIYVSALGWAEV